MSWYSPDITSAGMLSSPFIFLMWPFLEECCQPLVWDIIEAFLCLSNLARVVGVDVDHLGPIGEGEGVISSYISTITGPLTSRCRNGLIFGLWFGLA